MLTSTESEHVGTNKGDYSTRIEEHRERSQNEGTMAFFLFAYRPETFKNYLLWIGQFSSFSTFSFGFPPWMFHNSTFKGSHKPSEMLRQRESWLCVV